MANKDIKKSNMPMIVGICAGVAVVVIVIIVSIILATSGNLGTISDDYFVSDGSKYVLTVESEPGGSATDDEPAPVKTHTVYYYSGDEITGCAVYYEFADNNAAQKANTAYSKIPKEELGDEVESFAVNEKYLVVTCGKAAYDGLTATDVKSTIDYMQSIKDSGAEEKEKDASGTESDGASEEASK